MSKKTDVTKYVKSVFDLYDANGYGFFFEYDNKGEVEIPLFPLSEIDDETLERISVQLGLGKDEILNMDKNAARRYWEKFEFFRLYARYKESCKWFSEFKSEKPTQEELLLNAIFGAKAGIEVERRYNYQAIKKRMIAQLKEIDKIMPGTYHENAQITNLEISTEFFMSFPECSDMIRSFVEMVDRLKELFFKALKEELTTDEEKEMNFLASWLIAKDVVTPRDLITYKTVRIYREVYLKENLSDFYSYAKIERFVGSAPWRCMEFFNDPDLVQKFVEIFPQAKREMIQFTMDVTKFSCTFVWSDAGPVVFSPEEEEELHEFNMAIGEEDTPLEERAREKTHIYVDKTRSEIYGWEQAIKRLKKAASPESKGGVVLPKKEKYPYPFDLTRMNDRNTAMINARGNK